MTWGISSRLASSRELGRVARLVVGRHGNWLQNPAAPWRWDRRAMRPAEFARRLDVTERPGEHPVLTACGRYS